MSDQKKSEQLAKLEKELADKQKAFKKAQLARFRRDKEKNQVVAAEEARKLDRECAALRREIKLLKSPERSTKELESTAQEETVKRAKSKTAAKRA